MKNTKSTSLAMLAFMALSASPVYASSTQPIPMQLVSNSSSTEICHAIRRWQKGGRSIYMMNANTSTSSFPVTINTSNCQRLTFTVPVQYKDKYIKANSDLLLTTAMNGVQVEPGAKMAVDLNS